MEKLFNSISLPLLGMACWIGLKYLERYLLEKKTDTKSKIKRESRCVHSKEDHNSHLSKRPGSTYLWNPAPEDLSIQRKLKNHLKVKCYNEKTE